MKLPMRVIEGWSCRWLLLLTLIAGMVEPLAQGRDWYVSPLGSDTADGSLQHPFATVHRAQLAIRSSQPLKQSATVWLRGGV